MSESSRSSRALKVYEAVPGPGATVKFIDEIVKYAPENVAFSFHSWKTAILGRYDVAHVHWPEFFLRDNKFSRRVAKRVVFRLFLARLTISRIPVVRTVHNVEPHHAGDEGERRLLRALDKKVRRHVVMSSCTPVTWTDPTVLIPHGDFLEVFEDFPREDRIKGRVLLFGRIHPYKGALELLRAASQVTDADTEIRIVGSPTPDMRVAIEQELGNSRGGATVTTDLRMVSDEEMVAEMTRAELIALPYQDAGNGNSGVAMVALSLGRPVLVYRSCLMEDLAAETGETWIQMMDDTISGEQIERALRNVGELAEADRPRLIGRDWRSVADAYATVFQDVVKER